MTTLEQKTKYAVDAANEAIAFLNTPGGKEALSNSMATAKKDARELCRASLINHDLLRQPVSV